MELFQGRQERRRAYRLAIIGFIMFNIGIWVAVFDPLDLIIESKLTMRPGSLIYTMWEKPPLEVYIKVYVFNITNADRFLRGIDKKVKLQEVGPYVYREYLENTNATFNDNYTISFYPRRRVEFIREKSVGDPKTDIVTIPNVPYMGVTTAASKISIIAAALIRALMRTLNSQIILNVTVHDYFWGIDDPLVSLASKIIPSIITFEKFGLLDRMFDEGTNLVTLNLPKPKHIKEEEQAAKAANKSLEEKVVKPNPQFTDEQEETLSDVLKEFKKMKLIKPTPPPTEKKSYRPPIRDFSIDSYNGGKGLSYWGFTPKESSQNTECNTLEGAYDATLFPRNISKGETFRIYRKPFCRTLPIVFSHPGEVDGVEAYFFKLADNAFDSSLNDSTTSCFCEKRVCLRKGLGNITPCYYTIPAAVSFPHFFNGDPSLLDTVEGLSPDEEKHGSEIVLQPQLGIPMRVHSRLQINLLMGEVKFNADMRRFHDTVLPIVWFEIAVESLTPGLLLLVQLLFNIAPYVQGAAIYVSIIAGVSIMGLAGLVFFSPAKQLQKPTAKVFNAKRELRYSMQIMPFFRRNFERCDDSEEEHLAESSGESIESG